MPTQPLSYAPSANTHPLNLSLYIYIYIYRSIDLSISWSLSLSLSSTESSPHHPKKRALFPNISGLTMENGLKARNGGGYGKPTAPSLTGAKMGTKGPEHGVLSEFSISSPIPGHFSLSQAGGWFWLSTFSPFPTLRPFSIPDRPNMIPNRENWHHH